VGAKPILVATLLLTLVATRLLASDLDQLLTGYKGYGLPLPPDDANLVRFESGGRYFINDVLMPPTSSLGFLLRAATKDRPALLLVGTQHIELESGHAVEFVEPSADIAKTVDFGWSGPATFELNDGLDPPKKYLLETPMSHKRAEFKKG
jgi:hypothetical protein